VQRPEDLCRHDALRVISVGQYRNQLGLGGLLSIFRAEPFGVLAVGVVRQHLLRG